MTIPLDRLYHYIESIAKKIDKDIVIYRFWPHGSKKIENLGPINGPINWSNAVLRVGIYCHDQEPLNYNLYQGEKESKNRFDKMKNYRLAKLTDSLIGNPYTNNLQRNYGIYESCIVHSEKRSKNLVKYQNDQCVLVYYWSHAIIALDWFRFAQHIQQLKQVKKIFLIYNRAWTGTREYRLYFSELLLKLNLQDLCQTWVNPIDAETNTHYAQHKFDNPIWTPQSILENYFNTSTASSNYSADFDIKDYESTDIEVVLETLFDDDRLHLTEKSLRPIACGQPFILAGTHGSLKYLHSYGFKTFGNIWDENYDSIEDPQKRLHAVTDLMSHIANWSLDERKIKMSQAQEIADYNRQWFFSQEFFDSITKELTDNLIIGISQSKSQSHADKFVNRLEYLLTFKEVRDCIEQADLESIANPESVGLVTKSEVDWVLKTIKNL